MTKYFSTVLLILIVSCKQANGNLDTKNDSIQPSQDATEIVDEKINYDAILTEAGEVLYSDQTEVNKFDSISNNLKAFIPTGFSVVSFATGDANLDGLTDTILVLQNNEDNIDYSLILLIKQKDGSYKLSIRTNSNLEGDNNTVKIDNGRIFIVNHYNAGFDISFFKFDKTGENWILKEKFSSGLDGKGDVTKIEEIITLDK